MELVSSWGTLFSPPQISSCILMPLGLLVMVGTFMGNGLKAIGSLSTALTLLLGSALTGRNYLLFILPAFSGVLTGPVNVFVSGVTTSLLLPSLIQKAQVTQDHGSGPLHYHSDPSA